MNQYTRDDPRLDDSFREGVPFVTPLPPQIRTCGTPAYGSSDHRLAESGLGGTSSMDEWLTRTRRSR